MSEKMTRKDFLSSLAFGGATLALFPWLSACSPPARASGSRKRRGKKLAWASSAPAPGASSTW